MSSATLRDYVSAALRAPMWGALGLRQVETIGVEPVSGWWENNSGFGRRFTGDLPATLANVQPIDLLNLEKCPGPPRTIGVQLYRSDKQVVTGANSDVKCQVTYGAGGTSNTFLLDWSAGAGFTLVANTLRLAFLPFLPHNLAVYTPLTNLILGATVGLNALPRSNVVLTTQPVRTVANLVSLQSAVPDFATGFHLLSYALGGVPVNLALIQIEFRASDNTVLDVMAASTVASQLYSTDGLRVPGTAQFVSVLNGTGANVLMGHQFVLGI